MQMMQPFQCCHTLPFLHTVMSDDKKSSAEKMPPPPAPADVESAEDSPVKPLSPAEKVQIEREQEQKLKAKYPQAARPMPAAPGGES